MMGKNNIDQPGVASIQATCLARRPAEIASGIAVDVEGRSKWRGSIKASEIPPHASVDLMNYLEVHGPASPLQIARSLNFTRRWMRLGEPEESNDRLLELFQSNGRVLGGKTLCHEDHVMLRRARQRGVIQRIEAAYYPVAPFLTLLRSHFDSAALGLPPSSLCDNVGHAIGTHGSNHHYLTISFSASPARGRRFPLSPPSKDLI